MPGLGTSFGRGGATTAQQDLQFSDAIFIMGSSMAENHPVGFQWVMEARKHGAKVIHVDPRFFRTSAMADYWLPLRAGTDIIFLGALINYTLAREKYFREYVVHYTNAGTILREDLRGPTTRKHGCTKVPRPKIQPLANTRGIQKPAGDTVRTGAVRPVSSASTRSI